jgi:hypothetical protein
LPYSVSLAARAKSREQVRLEDIMNGVTILGWLLIILGIVGLIVGGVSYTKDEHKADLGPIDLTVKEKEHVRIPPALAILALIGGTLLVVAGSRRRNV